MGWLSLLWLVVTFGLFYLLAPALARGGSGQRSWPLRLVKSYVTSSFVSLLVISALGVAGLALPGFVLVLGAAWIAFEALRSRRHLLTAAFWRERAVSLLQSRGRMPLIVHLRKSARPLGEAGPDLALWLFLFTVYFLSRASFAAGNLRFLDAENYSRSLSLAVLSAGQPWQVDFSVPLLLPLQFLTALPPPTIVRLTGPLVSLLFVLAVAFVAFEYTRSGNAALLASAFSMVVPVWRGAVPGSEIGAPEFVALFAVAAVALARRSPPCALLAATIALAIGPSPVALSTLAAGIACAAGGAGLDRVSILISNPWRLTFRTAAALAASVYLSWNVPATPPDGPHQYEVAARICDRIAQTHDRNTWLIVSSSEELPFLYGRGWHLPLASFASEYTDGQLASPSFRFPYPVRDIFLFVERQPLRRSSGSANPAATGLVRAAAPAPRLVADAARASLQFKAARLLASYGKSHADLEIVHASPELTVYRIPGALAQTRQRK